ncbi:MAG: hypothetical protein E6686_03540 [Lachnospiraceae bacterium]|nr:hypothetical protein [Lachnospiraceae bacterium]
MANCEIYEEIGKGQCEKKAYRIWTIFKRESTLLYWYLVLYDDTYYEKFGNGEMDEDALTNMAIDIRKLPNYKDISGIDILFHRKESVVPLIKEAVRKGYIKPV